MAKYALVRCTAQNGVLLRLFEMQAEIRGLQAHEGNDGGSVSLGVPIGRPTGQQFELMASDRNVVPWEFWAEWQKQHPQGMPHVSLVGTIESTGQPDESPRAP